VVRTPLSVLFAHLADTRAMLEDLLTRQSVSAEEVLAEIRLCQSAVEACVLWKGANDRERSVRSAVDNTLRSCQDGLRMAELGLFRNRRDMVESSSRTLSVAHERMLAMSRVLED
jgi:hypothetical protein